MQARYAQFLDFIVFQDLKLILITFVALAQLHEGDQQAEAVATTSAEPDGTCQESCSPLVVLYKDIGTVASGEIPLPADEQQRSCQLCSYNILDTVSVLKRVACISHGNIATASAVKVEFHARQLNVWCELQCLTSVVKQASKHSSLHHPGKVPKCRSL